MIEKVMKAVKRNSKRRSVNITIGAVVGFLLSCTTVMGAAVEIEGNDEKFEVTSSAIEGNTFENNTYTNNGEIKPKAGAGGIRISGKSANKELSFVNNGVIDVQSYEGMKIDTDADMIGKITNNGTISSTVAEGIKILGKLTADAAGIAVENNGTIKANTQGIIIGDDAEVKGDVINNGNIESKGKGETSGIKILEGTTNGNIYNTGAIETESTASENSNGILVKGTVTENIENTGTISSATNSGKSYGINIAEAVTAGGIKNAGIINGSNYGVYNDGTITGNIENNGVINSTSEKYNISIDNNVKIDGNIINRGLITVTSSLENSATGIANYSTEALNTGYIIVNGDSNSSGIRDYTAGTITNNGNIYVYSKSTSTLDTGGIVVPGTIDIGINISNNGLINTTGNGIQLTNTFSKINLLTNEGVIYGKKAAIHMQNRAIITSNYNYGLLISEGNDRTKVLNGITLTENYGLAFSVGIEGNAGKYYVQATEEYKGDEHTIVNADLENHNEGTGEVTGTESVLSSALTTDSNNKYIINGIDNTLKVVDTDKTLKSSVINAYGTAMVMEDGKALTVEGTIFNGGIKIKPDKADGNIPTPTISLAGNNTLNLSKESIVNGNMEIGGNSNTLDMSESSVNGKMEATGDSNELIISESYLNDEMTITGSNNTLSMDKSSMNGKMAATGNDNKLTIKESGINDELAVTGDNNTLNITNSNLNKKIAIDGKDNTLTISGDNTFINGDMDATGEKNTVNLAGKTGEDSSLNMFNKVTGFEDMNIDNNVTFFENAEVTGVKNLTVAEDGTLNLRLKKLEEQNEDGLTKGGHAFSGNGEMVMEGLGDGGILKFITNGIGEGVWIDTSDMQIKNMIVKTNSVLDKYKFDEDGNLILKAVDTLGDMNSSGDKITDSKDPTGDGSGGGSDDGPGDGNIGDSNIFDKENFDSIDGIYKGIVSSTNKNDNLNALRNLAMTDKNTGDLNEVMSKEEQMENLQAYLNEIYTQSPYALSSELSRRSAGMFRDIVTENMFRPDLNKWMIMGGLTHIDGGTKDTYYGEVYQLDGKNSLNTEADMKLTGAYALGKYGYSENVALGVTVGGNRSEAELSKSKVKGNSGYIGAFAENYRGNLTLKAGAGIQYSEYDADRSTVGGHSYNDKYSDMAYDIYLNGRYSNPVGGNLFLEPYATLSYTYVDQDGTDEGSKALAIKTDSKSFEYTSAEVGVDLKKVIPHEKGKSTLSAGVSYTRLLNGADSDKLTGNFGGSDFDILVAGKNKHNLGLNAKYTLELESGVLFDVKGSYSFERDSHKDNARNRNKGEWMVGAGLGYKF